MKTNEESSISKLHFIIAPRSGQCARSGAQIPKGITCLERISISGKTEWYSIGSETFAWWVVHHTKLGLEQAKRGLCNHGVLAMCEQCREITPGWEVPAPIADRKLWDDCGNYCRISMHQIGRDVFEVWFHRFNDATPTRFVGKLGECIERGDEWISHRKDEGFREQLPGYEPCPKN